MEKANPTRPRQLVHSLAIFDDISCVLVFIDFEGLSAILEALIEHRLSSSSTPAYHKLLLTLAEAQELTGLSRDILRQAISQGTLYYPDPDPDEPELDPELKLGIQYETRFLQKSQIPQFIAEFRLEELSADFEARVPQTQMVLAVVTEGQMGVLTFDVTRPENKALPTKIKRTKLKGFGPG